MDFISNEIFQAREALINWVRKADKSQGFMIIIKKSNAEDSEKRKGIS